MVCFAFHISAEKLDAIYTSLSISCGEIKQITVANQA
jgi:hypothetical protein